MTGPGQIGRRSWLLRPSSPLDPSPLSMAVSYALLGFWAFVVLFPLYWVFITSFKLPIDVNDGPFYLMWVDFQPSAHAWKYIFVDLGRDTFRPYLNSVIVALISSALALALGSMAGYGLAPHALPAAPGQHRAVRPAAWRSPSPRSSASACRGRSRWPRRSPCSCCWLQTVGRRFKRALGNDDIAFWMISQRILPPVAVVIPVYVLFQQIGPARFARRADHHLRRGQPADRGLADARFLPGDPARARGIGDDRRRLALHASSVKIVLPISRPSLASAFLLMLILTWNEYLLALMLSTADTQTLPLLIAAQNATRGPQWWYMSVLILIMIVPVVAMAIALERYIRRGMLIGAVKG